MSFHKGVDNARHCAPPDRVAEQNGVVIRKIHRLPADSRTRRGIVHLPVGAAIVVVVINIVLGVRLRRHDLVHIRAQLIRDLLRRRFGVAGAAIATGISQCVGGIIPLIYFIRPNDSLLHLTGARLEWRPILAASANGSSELVSNITASIVGMLYNFQLLEYAGQDGVAAYGVLMYVEFIFVAIFVGYSIGSAPIISYHYGAENHAELQNMLRKSILLMLGGGVLMLIAAQILAGPLAHMFVGYDKTLFDMTVHGFRIFSLFILFAGFNIFASSFFTALNNGGVSAAISFLRTFVFKFSAVLLMPLLFKLDGIWWATVVAEVLAFILSAAFILSKRQKYHY